MPPASFFSRLPQSTAKKPQLPPPRCICKLSTVSARSRRSYGKIEDYDPKSLSAYGFILPLMPHFHPVSPTPPHPAPRALCNRTIPGEDLFEGGHNTAEKILGEVCGWIFSLKTPQTRKKTKRRTFGITMVSILQVRRFLIQAEVLVRGLRTRCLYSVWKYLPSLSSLHELVSKRPKNVKLC